MKSRYLNWLAPLALIPLLLEMPYVFRAIVDSPLESKNSVFLILAVVQVVFSLFRGYRNKTLKLLEKPTGVGVCLTVMVLAGLAVSYYKHIHFAILLFSVCLMGTVACTVCNWSTACALLPACAMVMLGIPSMGFLLNSATGLNGLVVKTILAVVLLLLTPLLAGRFCPRPKDFLYACACLAVAACYGIKMTAGHMAPSLRLRLQTLSADGFNGTNMEISEADRAFYGDSDIRRYLFGDTAGKAVQVLAVAKIADIHAIHPMAYCLRASGVLLESEQTIAIMLAGHDRFVHEISASQDGRRFLYWQWYSTSEQSTADFLLFRSVYSAKDDWCVTQIVTAADDSAEEARMRLLQFTKAFRFSETK